MYICQNALDEEVCFKENPWNKKINNQMKILMENIWLVIGFKKCDDKSSTVVYAGRSIYLWFNTLYKLYFCIIIAIIIATNSFR